MKKQYPFRLGTTSYIIPDEIVPNVRYLADKVQDIELVLFEVDDGYNNLPDQATISELNLLAQSFDLSYTIHLPVDLNFMATGDILAYAVSKAKRTIEKTLPLNPHAFVLHLESDQLRQPQPAYSKEAWTEKAQSFLDLLKSWVQNETLLAVENLEGYPLNFWDEIIDQAGVSRCIDIGHLWLDAHDPLPYLERHLNKTRVIHIHGIQERDHKSLEHVPDAQLQPVFELLWKQNYQGVITIEVFNEQDLKSSIEVIRRISKPA